MAKKSFKPDYNACIGKDKHENFGSIYESMVKSDQFRALSNPAKLLYVYCRIQQNSGSGRACLHNHEKEEGVKYPQACFVFPAKMQLEYGLQRTNSQRYFNELIKAGFIEKYEANKHRKKSISIGLLVTGKTVVKTFSCVYSI